MKKFYNIMLVILHCIGLIFTSAFSLSRFVFYPSWPPQDDFVLWTLIIAVLLIHYGLLFLGYKLRFLSANILHALKKVEIVHAYGQLALIVLLFIICWFRVPFVASYPIFVVPVAALILRILTNKFVFTQNNSTE